MSRTVLVVDDEQNLVTVMRMTLEDAGYAVHTASSAEAALPLLTDPNLDVLITDLRMPGMGGEELLARARNERPDIPVIVVTAHGTIKSAVKSVSSGAADYLTKPFEPEELQIAVHNAVRLRDILRENANLRASVSQTQGQKRLLGEGPAARKLGEDIHKVAPYKTNVLVTGESGTGKEVVARTIHELSPRAEHPLVALNCSAIPRDLLESELFGYVKGAFTGASQNRSGRLEQAQGGTLFLDESGDMDLGLQAKLLRVLQEREYSPVGSDQVRKVDIRVIAATNRDLKALVADGKFREDLFYRLDVYSILVPPLRERLEDVPLLAHAFLKQLCAETDKHIDGFTAAAMDVMRRYNWPGNIRELRNAVERSLLSARGAEIDVNDLPYAILRGTGHVRGDTAPPEGPTNQDLDAWLEGLERRAILKALEQNAGVQAQAAKQLGITERSLWHRVKKLAIQVNKVVR